MKKTLSLLAASAAMCAAHAATYVYVSNAEDGTISGYQLNTGSGSLRPVGVTPAGALVMPLAISPDRRYLYASIRSKPYGAATYLIDSSSGGLTRLSTAALPDSMAYISTDKSGRFLFGASFGGDVVSVNPIGAQGWVQGEALQVIKTGRHAHSILVDPSNRFVYTGNLGEHRVLQWRLDEKAGKLTPIGEGFAAAEAGDGPRHLAFAPNGRYLYVLNELSGTVTTYGIDQTIGALTRQSSAAGVPTEYKLEKGLIRPPLGQGEKVDDTPRIWAADVKMTPDGRFLYMSERTSSSISWFQVDPSNGALRFGGNIPVEKQPRGFNIDPRGRHMVVAGEKVTEVGVYAIDSESGALRRVGGAPAGNGANWVEIVEFN